MIFFAYTRSSPISIAKKSSNIFFPIEIGGPKFLSRGSPSQTLSQAFRCGAASARNFKLPLAFEGRLTWLRFFFSCAGRNCKKKCTSNNYSTRFFSPRWQLTSQQKLAVLSWHGAGLAAYPMATKWCLECCISF